MLKKGAKIYSILFGVCPKYHKESMYMIKNPYRLYDTLKMHERCKHCGTKYKIEPSFFYGSMYVSYGVGTAFSVAAFIITYLFLERSLKNELCSHCNYIDMFYACLRAPFFKYLD